MPRWLQSLLVVVVVLSAVCSVSAVTLSALAYVETRKPDQVPVVQQVIEVDDPELATALMLLGECRVEIQGLVRLAEDYAKLLAAYNERLIQEIRKK